MTAPEYDASAAGPERDGATAVVLVGMSPREVIHEADLTGLAGSAGATVAFLQLGDPSLWSEVSRLAALGTERVTLVGVSLGTMAPANSWLRRITGHWVRQQRKAGTSLPEVHVATSMVRADLTTDSLDLALDVTRPVCGEEAGLVSAAWEDVPGYRHHVLLCRGPRCTARGSDSTAESLKRDLNARGVGEDHVLVTQTGCLFPCNHAPVVAVQPDDVWYAGVDADTAARITDEHLLGGTPVEDHRLPRRRVRPDPACQPHLDPED